MAIVKIVVTAHIHTGRLFTEEGYDVERSAENLADVEGDLITGLLAEEYPDTEIYVDIGIHKDADGASTIEVSAYSGEEQVDDAVSAVIQQRLVKAIVEGTADYAWAVKAG